MTIDVPSLVTAAGGEIVGKVRLQKIVYLLDQLGLNSGFSYEYRHYGPYSEDLADEVEGDRIFGRIKADQKYRQRDGVPYVVYGVGDPSKGDPTDRHPFPDDLREALAEMNRCSATVLELAATMHWLKVVEHLDNWRAELNKRKGVKAEEGRDNEALELLRKLELPPAVDSAVLA